MAVFFVVVFFTSLPCYSDAPLAEKAPFQKAIAAAPCPDDAALWCVAVAVPQNPGFYKEPATGKVSYRPAVQNTVRVEKLTVVFPEDLDKWQEKFVRWGTTKEALILAAYNGEAFPEEFTLRLNTKYHGLCSADTFAVLETKRTSSTIGIFSVTKTSESVNHWMFASCLCVIIGFMGCGYFSGSYRRTRRKFDGTGVNLSRSDLWLFYPAKELAGGSILFASIALFIPSVLCALQVFGENNVSWLTAVLSVAMLIAAVKARLLLRYAERNEAFIVSMKHYRKAAITAFLAFVLFLAALVTIGGFSAVSYFLLWLVLAFVFGAGMGFLCSYIAYREQKTANAPEKA